MGMAQNPLHPLFRPKQAAQESQEFLMWVAMTLRDWKRTSGPQEF